MAVASSGLFLASNVGMVSGISIAAAILQSTLRKQLRISLEGLDGRDERIMLISSIRGFTPWSGSRTHFGFVYKGASLMMRNQVGSLELISIAAIGRL
ncbi:unnamed protein product [Sphagnum balticum]